MIRSTQIVLRGMPIPNIACTARLQPNTWELNWLSTNPATAGKDLSILSSRLFSRKLIIALFEVNTKYGSTGPFHIVTGSLPPCKVTYSTVATLATCGIGYGIMRGTNKSTDRQK